MCRLLAYHGPRTDLESLLYTPEWSLERQSYEPRQQKYGVINADGWGVGWYDPGRPEPARYRTRQPMWSDANLRNLAGVLSAEVVVASVRSATPPSPTEDTGTAPFTWGRWLFTHNGRVHGFRDGVGIALRDRLEPRWESTVVGAADSEVLFALVMQAIEGDGLAPEKALAGTVDLVRRQQDGRLNFILSDGLRIFTVRYGDETIFVRRGEVDGRPATWVASEPTDDGEDWQEVPDATIVAVGPDGEHTRSTIDEYL